MAGRRRRPIGVQAALDETLLKTAHAAGRDVGGAGHPFHLGVRSSCWNVSSCGATARSDTERAFSHSRSLVQQEIKMLRKNRSLAVVVHQRSVFTLRAPQVLRTPAAVDLAIARPLTNRNHTIASQCAAVGRKLRPNRMLPGACRLSERGRSVIPRTLGLARGWRSGSVLDHVHPRNPLRQVSPSPASSRRRS